MVGLLFLAGRAQFPGLGAVNSEARPVPRVGLSEQDPGSEQVGLPSPWQGSFTLPENDEEIISTAQVSNAVHKRQLCFLQFLGSVLLICVYRVRGLHIIKCTRALPPHVRSNRRRYGV